ncbi:Fic family protein [Cryomorpha ignava]|uniref:Fic family protein n=1 Tax=Cryomorpha ignava TaxID=101383 RepID=A0A7K3WRF4_9FLAO|nr:Fic family protein [Cryomorpha ignava]
MKLYIYEKTDWPNFNWDSSKLIMPLSEVRNLQGKLLGKMESLGFELRSDALLKTLTLDVLKSTEIEGEFLNSDQVRSSIARKLGMEISGSVPSDRDVDGVVEMMLDSTQNCFDPMSKERLFDWHAALFPTGRSGMIPITVADWRKDLKGPMQVVSGAMGKEKIHFEAPDSSRVEEEMKAFLKWFNSTQNIDLVIKAATAHLWFVTIHPFDDGNGRITRALTDLLLARSDNTTQRFYSMSAQIRKERKKYYEMLELSQKGELDITTWIVWFLNCLIKALKSTESVLNDVLIKAQFWNCNAKTILNERQKKMMNKLLDGFDGKLTSSKWAKITKCSKDTALRDIQDLIEKKVLQKEAAGGRSTNYELVVV